jgi:hypothetical protein
VNSGGAALGAGKEFIGPDGRTDDLHDHGLEH